MEERTPLVGASPQGDTALQYEYPNPVYEHRVVSGLSVDQLARLELFLRSTENMLTVRPAKIHMPGEMGWSHKELNGVPVLDMTDVVKGYPYMKIVAFAKSPKRDVKTGLYTVDLLVPIALAYVLGTADGDPNCEVGMYVFSRRHFDEITLALGLYSEEGRGQLIKVMEGDDN